MTRKNFCTCSVQMWPLSVCDLLHKRVQSNARWVLDRDQTEAAFGLPAFHFIIRVVLLQCWACGKLTFYLLKRPWIFRNTFELCWVIPTGVESLDMESKLYHYSTYLPKCLGEKKNPWVWKYKIFLDLFFLINKKCVYLLWLPEVGTVGQRVKDTIFS